MRTIIPEGSLVSTTQSSSGAPPPKFSDFISRTYPPSCSLSGPGRVLDMDLPTLLNAKMPVAKQIIGRPMQYDMQHNMPPHDLQQPQPQQPQYPPAYMNGRVKSETNSERGVSPHPSDHSSRYSSAAPQPLQSYPPPMPNAMQNGMRYPSPTHMQQSGVPLLNNYNMPADHGYPQQMTPDQQNQTAGGAPPAPSGPPKAFACSTCGKGFARRSDLARHGTPASATDRG
jgi:hypothetical protein